MAILHPATLSPSKLEILTSHLDAVPTLSDLAATGLTLVGAYRFDDPAGRVGIESHLLAASSGETIHMPLTYRGAPVAELERDLISTMEHSVLGTRWVYNACGDPVYVAELIRTILTGDTQVDLVLETADGPVVREPSATVEGSGTPASPVPVIDTVDATFGGDQTVIRAGGIEVVVRHVLDADEPSDRPMLSGQWGAEAPSVLAFIR